MDAINPVTRVTGIETRTFRRYGPVAIPDGASGGPMNRKAVEDRVIAKYFNVPRERLVIVWARNMMSIRLRGLDAPPIVVEAKEFQTRVC